MRYNLEWTPEADDWFTNLWINAPDRNAVTRAEYRIDQVLKTDPHRGHHVAEGLYSFYIAPLTVYYEIDEANTKVTVTACALS